MREKEYLITYNAAKVSDKTGCISLGDLKTTTIKAESRCWAIRNMMSREHVYCVVTLREIKIIIPFRERLMKWLGKEIN